MLNSITLPTNKDWQSHGFPCMLFTATVGRFDLESAIERDEHCVFHQPEAQDIAARALR